MVHIVLLSLALAVVAVQSFQTLPSWRASRRHSCGIMMDSSNQGSSKSLQVFKNMAVALALSSSLGLGSPVLAANYGGFGGQYAGVVNPKDAVFNDETKGSSDVKAGKEALNSLITTVVAIKNDLGQNSQMDLLQRITQDLPVNKVRDALNKYNGAFSEETQRGTDRLIRQVIQQITELQRESQVKPGKLRSPAKVSIAIKTLDTAEATLRELAAFNP